MWEGLIRPSHSAFLHIYWSIIRRDVTVPISHLAKQTKSRKCAQIKSGDIQPRQRARERIKSLKFRCCHFYSFIYIQRSRTKWIRYSSRWLLDYDLFQICYYVKVLLPGLSLSITFSIIIHACDFSAIMSTLLYRFKQTEYHQNMDLHECKFSIYNVLYMEWSNKDRLSHLWDSNTLLNFIIKVGGHSIDLP